LQLYPLRLSITLPARREALFWSHQGGASVHFQPGEQPDDGDYRDITVLETPGWISTLKVARDSSKVTSMLWNISMPCETLMPGSIGLASPSEIPYTI